MRINTNRWNKIRYTIYTPVYDLAGRIFSISRKRSIDALEIKPGERVLIVGAGTGLDLEYFPAGCHIDATDITPSMVEKIKKRSQTLRMNVSVRVMDGQKLTYHDGTFDKVVLHLILAVIPDPVACLLETQRVLKPGGKIAVFDKFVSANRKVTFLRRLLNKLTNFLFSDITRSFESIAAHSCLKILSDVKADFRGNFRIITVQKPVSESAKADL